MKAYALGSAREQGRTGSVTLQTPRGRQWCLDKNPSQEERQRTPAAGAGLHLSSTDGHTEEVANSVFSWHPG